MPINQRTEITPKQLAVLRQVGNFQKNQCYSATIGELAQALDISRTTAYEHIAALREKKLLAASTGKARCLKLAAKGVKLLKEAEQLETNGTVQAIHRFDDPASERIYLRGRISAGYGVDAIQESEPFSLGDVFGNRGDIFALQVYGQSMIDAGIHNGDYIMCRQAVTAQNGQLVVALLDDGENATVKRFFKDANAVRLQPENDAFKPILSTKCQIQAIVLGIVRQF